MADGWPPYDGALAARILALEAENAALRGVAKAGKQSAKDSVSLEAIKAHEERIYAEHIVDGRDLMLARDGPEQEIRRAFLAAYHKLADFPVDPFKCEVCVRIEFRRVRP